jgi:hypothetical protein
MWHIQSLVFFHFILLSGYFYNCYHSFKIKDGKGKGKWLSGKQIIKDLYSHAVDLKCLLLYLQIHLSLRFT